MTPCQSNHRYHDHASFVLPSLHLMPSLSVFIFFPFLSEIPPQLSCFLFLFFLFSPSFHSFRFLYSFSSFQFACCNQVPEDHSLALAQLPEFSTDGNEEESASAAAAKAKQDASRSELGQPPFGPVSFSPCLRFRSSFFLLSCLLLIFPLIPCLAAAAAKAKQDASRSELGSDFSLCLVSLVAFPLSSFLCVFFLPSFHFVAFLVFPCLVFALFCLCCARQLCLLNSILFHGLVSLSLFLTLSFRR